MKTKWVLSTGKPGAMPVLDKGHWCKRNEKIQVMMVAAYRRKTFIKL